MILCAATCKNKNFSSHVRPIAAKPCKEQEFTIFMKDGKNIQTQKTTISRIVKGHNINHREARNITGQHQIRPQHHDDRVHGVQHHNHI